MTIHIQWKTEIDGEREREKTEQAEDEINAFFELFVLNIWKWKRSMVRERENDKMRERTHFVGETRRTFEKYLRWKLEQSKWKTKKSTNTEKEIEKTFWQCEKSQSLLISFSFHQCAVIRFSLLLTHFPSRLYAIDWISFRYQLSHISLAELKRTFAAFSPCASRSFGVCRKLSIFQIHAIRPINFIYRCVHIHRHCHHCRCRSTTPLYIGKRKIRL